jgi:hypothetical protein
MSSGLCPRCGDASGERHLCVPPFLDRPAGTYTLDRGTLTYNASAPPQWCAPDPNPHATQVAALRAENARLRALIARYADVIGDDARDVLPGVPF